MRPFQKILLKEIEKINRWHKLKLITYEEEVIMSAAIGFLTMELTQHYERERIEMQKRIQQN